MKAQSLSSAELEPSIGKPAVLLLLFTLTYLVYLPGLSGGFVLDDLANLEALGFYGEIDNFQSFWSYVLSGFSGPTGRPLSMASFLIDARNWPADPAPFKHTNILIHIIVGIVLFGLLQQLARIVESRSHVAFAAAFFATALWVLHPLWVSTTLYVVQRMAQLSTLFVLAGLWLYVRTRVTHPPKARVGIVLPMILSVWGFGLLAILSKENGALLPLLALVIEGTLLSFHCRRQSFRATRAFIWWRRTILGLPLALLSAYLFSRTGALFSDDPGIRSFTALERLMTQGRILWEYVGHLALPRPVTGGVFQDHIAVSTGLFSPLTTVVAWGCWVFVVTLALVWRLRFPVFSAAALFFMAGHLLESSVVSLELYFEHRNYLPATLLGLPLALAWMRWDRPDVLSRFIIPLLFITIFSIITVQRSDVWGSPFRQAIAWADIREESPRAQDYLAQLWLDTGDLEEAERLIERAVLIDPKGVAWRIRLVVLACKQGRELNEPLDLAIGVISEMKAMGSVERFQVSTLLEFLHSGDCQHAISNTEVLHVIDRLEEDDRNRSENNLRSTLELWRGHILLSGGEPKLAMEAYRRALGERPEPEKVLSISARLASAGYLEEAINFLETTEFVVATDGGWNNRLKAHFLKKTEYYDYERDRLRRVILEDLRRSRKAGLPP